MSSSGEGTTRSVVFDVSRRNVWPAPFTGRCLNNSYTQRWKGRELELMRQGGEECIRFQEAQQRGDFDIAPVIAGEAAGLIHDISPASEIIRRIVNEAEALLSRAGRPARARETEQLI